MNGTVDKARVSTFLQETYIEPLESSLRQLDGSKSTPPSVGLAQALNLAIYKDPSEDDRESQDVKDARSSILTELLKAATRLENLSHYLEANKLSSLGAGRVRDLAERYLISIQGFIEDFYLKTKQREKLNLLVARFKKLSKFR